MGTLIVENHDQVKNYKTIVDGYLTKVIHEIASDEGSHSEKLQTDVDDVVECIYQILTSRQFTYQSKTKVLHLKDSVCEILRSDVERNVPLEVYFDLGGGYHAEIAEKNAGIDRYGVGLAELFVIYQIKMINTKIKQVYSPGIIFHIIIDNYVAFLVNDIPLAETERYCKSFSKLIKLLQMDNVINLLIESKAEEVVKGLGDLSCEDCGEITEKQFDNVQRFSKERLSYEDACKKFSRYQSICKKSDELLQKLIGRKIRFLQYSNGEEMTFRSYPGGAARIQCGYVGFEISEDNVKPKLFTNVNYSEEDCSVSEFDLQKKIMECLS